jgi:hypothetical protein
VRQHLIAIIIKHLPLASGPHGYRRSNFDGVWPQTRGVPVSRYVTKSEDLQAEKLGKELEAMSPEQIQTKAKNDLEDEEELEPVLMVAPSPSAVSTVLAVEQALLGRISSCLDSSVKVMSNQRLGNVEYDAIIRATGTKRIIVEIKYIRKGFSRGWLSETVNGLVSRMALYTKTFDESSSGVLLIVIATSNSPLARKVKDISEELRNSYPSRLDNIRIRTIYEAEIATISCLDLRNVVLGDLDGSA